MSLDISISLRNTHISWKKYRFWYSFIKQDAYNRFQTFSDINTSQSKSWLSPSRRHPVQQILQTPRSSCERLETPESCDAGGTTWALFNTHRPQSHSEILKTTGRTCIMKGCVALCCCMIKWRVLFYKSYGCRLYTPNKGWSFPSIQQYVNRVVCLKTVGKKCLDDLLFLARIITVEWLTNTLRISASESFKRCSSFVNRT